jgi:hypothetical protein
MEQFVTQQAGNMNLIHLMNLIGGSEDGTYAGYSDEYKNKAWSILTLLQAELLPASVTPSVITSNTSVFQVDDRTSLTVLTLWIGCSFTDE